MGKAGVQQGLVFGGLIFGMVVVLWIARHVQGLHARDRLGSAVQWDPKESWISTITAAGALVGTVLTASSVIFPSETQLLFKAGYAAVSVFFGTLTVMAPLVYKAWVGSVPARNDNEGYVGVFCVASAITLWGVSGQLATLGLLVWEMVQKQQITLTWLIAGIFWAFIFLAIFVFIPRSADLAMRTILKTAQPAPSPPAPGVALTSAPPLPGWSLL